MTSADFSHEFPILEDLNPENYDSLAVSNFSILSKKRICAISCCLVVLNVALAVEFSIATPLMAIFKMNYAIIAFVWVLCSVFTFFINPLSASVSDSFSNKFGRRRLFILIGGILILISIASFYFINRFADRSLRNADKTPSLKQNLVFIGFFFSLLLLHSSIKLIHIPSQSLILELVPNHQYEQARFISQLTSSISSILTFAVGGLRLTRYIYKATEDEGLKNIQILIIFSFFVILIALIICLVATKENPPNSQVQFQNPFKQMIQVLHFGPKAIFRMGFIYLFSWAAYSPILTYLTTSFCYGCYHKEREFTIEGHCYGMIAFALIQICELLSIYFVPRIVAKINMKWTYFISMLLLSFLLISTAFVHNLYALLVIYSLTGFCACTFKSIPFSLIRIIVPAEQFSVHRNIFNAAASIGSSISMIILGGIVGYKSQPKTEIIIAGGSIFALIAAILCKWMIIPTRATEEQDFLQSNPVR